MIATRSLASLLLAASIAIVTTSAVASPAQPAEVTRLDEAAGLAANAVQLAPSRKGVFGAWLVAGPFRAGRPALESSPFGLDDKNLKPVLGAPLGGERDLGQKHKPPARWTLVSTDSRNPRGPDPGLSGSRAVDLKT